MYRSLRTNEQGFCVTGRSKYCTETMAFMSLWRHFPLEIQKDAIDVVVKETRFMFMNVAEANTAIV